MSELSLADVKPLIPKMRAYAFALTRSSAEADDLVQESLLRAWRYREGFYEGTNLKAWLFRIMRNEFFRMVGAKKGTVEDVDGRYAALLVSHPDQEFNLRFRELMRAINLLSEDTREALLLTVGSGFSYVEAAELCGCAVGTMKSRVNRARHILSSHLDEPLAQSA